MTGSKRFSSWRDLRAQATRLQSLQQLVAQAQEELAHLTAAHAREKQQWLEQLRVMELDIRTMQQAEQELRAAAQQIEQQRQAAWSEAEARGLHIAELEHQLAQAQHKLHEQRDGSPHVTNQQLQAQQQQLKELQLQLQESQGQLEQRTQQIAALEAQLRQTAQNQTTQNPEPSPDPEPAPEPVPLKATAGRLLSQRPIQLGLLAGLLVGLLVGLRQIQRPVLEFAPSPRPSTQATHSPPVLQLNSREPSWLEVRNLSGRSVYLGMLEGEKRFPLGNGLQVLAGRPDLVTARVSDSPARVLGTVNDVDWITFRPRQKELANGQ